MNLNVPSVPTPPAPNIPSTPPQSWKPSLIYWLTATVILFAVGLLGLLSSNYPTGAYIGMQLVCLLLGVVHLRMMYRLLDWPRPMSFFPAFAFSLGIGLSAAAAMVAFYVLLAKTSAWIYASAFLLFPLPFVLYIAFEYYWAIPARSYKIWYYPLEKEMPDMDMLDLSKIIIVNFEFTRTVGERALTQFKAKAPAKMLFADLFFVFLNDYNERHSNSTIQITDERGRPYGWLFFSRGKWWQRRRYFDPEADFEQNRIREGEKITALRTPPFKADA
jgi:hypothetical protein